MSSIKHRHILHLSSEEKRKFLDSFDFVFSDIDGVLWTMEDLCEGAGEGYKELQKAGKSITFVTNNSVRPLNSCEERFKSIGLSVNKDDIWHPAKSMVQYLRRINFDGLIYIIASENFKQILRDAGYKMIDGPTKILEETFRDLATHVFDNEPVKAVVIDVDFNLSAAKLMRAHQYLLSPQCLLIAGATDNMLPVTKNACIIGPGPFADVLQKASGKEMITVGKPGKQLAKMLLQDFNISEPRRALMVGDMLEQDIGFAKKCGLQSLLVLSGGCTLAELNAQQNLDLIPDFYADSMADFVEFMKDLNKSNV